MSAEALTLPQRLVDEPHVAVLQVARRASTTSFELLDDVPLAKSSRFNDAVRNPGRRVEPPAPVMPPPR